MSDGPTGSTGPAGQTSDSTGSVGIGQVPNITVSTGPAAPVVITLADILSATEIVRQKEAADKSALESIGSVTFDSLRTKLIQWATSGFPNAFTLMEVFVSPPAVCSDGVTRDLANYIIHCSGKTLAEHVAALQAKLPDIVVSFANTGASIAIVISKQQSS